jgi:hypothetical protein
VVVGASITWGWGVEKAERYSNIVEGRTGIRTFNVSTPTDIEGYLRLLRYAQSLGGNIGRLVVTVSMETDLKSYAPRTEEAHAATDEEAPYASWKPWLERHSAAYLFITTVVRRTSWLNALAVRAGLITPNLAGISHNDDVLEAVEATADMIVEVSSRYRTLVMLIPSRGLWVGANRTVENRVHNSLLAALASRGVDVIDLRPWFEADNRPLGYHFANDGHWNARGHALAAEAIIERLPTLGFVALRAPQRLQRDR